MSGSRWVHIGICLLWMSTMVVADETNPPPRSVWLWSQHGFPMLDSPQLGLASLDFLQQKDINTIYLYADLDSYHKRNVLVDEPEKYRSFIAEAHNRGMKVFALFGDNGRDTEGWILPDRQNEAITAFQNMFDYNASVQPDERFDGANMDIEPYILQDWADKTVERATQYLNLSAKFMDMKRQYLNGLGQTDLSQFPVGPATPFWFETIDDIEWQDPFLPSTAPVSKPLYEHVLDVHDYITIMDYRDFAQTREDRGDGIAPGRTDGIVNLAVEELLYASMIGKPVYIGVETSPTSPTYVSFLEEGPEIFERELAIALTEFQNNWPDVFSGFVLHDFIWYQRLIAQGPFITGVPEPTTAWVWLAGLAGWVVLRRCRSIV